MNQINSHFHRIPRTYERVWRQLRLPPHLVVLEVLDPEFVPRIRRMISKEKDMDIGFKSMQDCERVYLKFSWDPAKLELTVELTNRLGITEVKG